MTERPLALTIVLAVLAVAPAAAQDALPDTAYVPGEYRVYTGAGDPATLEDVIAAMADVDVVFIGEAHDDPTGHMLESALLEGAWRAYGAPSSEMGPTRTGEVAKPREGEVTTPREGAGVTPRAREGAALRVVALSLEFFERDVQLVLDEYLAGLITEAAFRAAARPWDRYGTDYRPLVEYAKERGIDVVAANAPRRYVSRVTRHGRKSLADLPPGALDHLPPLPYGEPSPAYRDQWIRVIAEVVAQEGTKCGVPLADSLAVAPMGSHADMGDQLDSQALWDATMAWSVAEHLRAHPGALVLHMVGGFHVARGTGIPEHLRAYTPDVGALIVVLRPVDDMAAFEPAPAGTWGDFVIQTEEARTLEAIECRAFRAEHGTG